MSGLFGGGGKAPKAPDYIGAAREQGVQNLAAIRTGAALNRVNQVTPYGRVTYSHGAGAPTTQPQHYGGMPPTSIPGGGTISNFGGNSGGSGGGVVGDVLSQVAVRAANNMGSGPAYNPQDEWTQTVELSPDQQAILDASESNQIDLGRIAGMRLGQVGNQGAFSFAGLPGQVSNVEQSNFQTEVGLPGAEQRQRAEDALYRSATRQLDPQFQQREDAMRSRLLNSGIREGTEAWNNEMGNFARERESAYGDARDRSINAGGQEASRMLSDELSRGQFGNNAQAQRFAQSLSNAELQNAGRATGASERLTERNLPLQEFLQMFGGTSPAGGINAPGVPQAGTPQPGDYQGAVGQQYGAQLDRYNARNAQANNTMNSLLTLGSIFAMSDRRAKTDIERVSALPNGLPVYRYRYLGEHKRRIGVMSDDVRKVAPDAVIVGADGFDRVNYTAIDAAHLLEMH